MPHRLLYFLVIVLSPAIVGGFPAAASAPIAHATEAGVSAYESGDYLRAMRKLEGPAHKGDKVAEHYLGLMYMYGQGVEPSPAEGVRWYSRAAKQEYAPAEAEMGVAYLQGSGVKQDLELAREWLARAATHGSSDAAYNLGTLYKDGSGVPVDIGKAIYWFTYAIKIGMRDEAHELGLLYLSHDDVPNSRVLGYMWLLIAVNDGDDEALDDVENFRSQLSDSERAEAEALARDSRE